MGSYFALLVSLRRPPHLVRADERHGFGDHGAAPEEVDASHPERGHFTEPDAGVGEEQDDQPVLIVVPLVEASVLAWACQAGGSAGELVHLLVCQVPLFERLWSRQLDVGGGVADQSTVPNGERQDE